MLPARHSTHRRVRAAAILVDVYLKVYYSVRGRRGPARGRGPRRRTRARGSTPAARRGPPDRRVHVRGGNLVNRFRVRDKGRMPKKGSKAKAKTRQVPLVLLASQRVVSPQRLPINPDAGAAGRYRMPQLVCIPTGKGKNSRVVLDNLDVVASSLQRPPNYITQYISYAAGVGKSGGDGGPGSAGGGIYSLSIDPARVEALLESFIQEWVLCIACGLPECDLLVEPGGGGRPTSVLLKCSACGHCVRSIPVPAPIGFPTICAQHPSCSAMYACSPCECDAGSAARRRDVKTKQVRTVYHS